MYYKNLSNVAKTFHGVTFNPGEVKEVQSYINDSLMVVVPAEFVKKPLKVDSKAEAKVEPKKEEKKADKPSGKESTSSES